MTLQERRPSKSTRSKREDPGARRDADDLSARPSAQVQSFYTKTNIYAEKVIVIAVLLVDPSGPALMRSSREAEDPVRL
jgi:hypothetical protein